MPLISPSILSCDFGHLYDEVQCVLDGGADWVHVDVMDGRFVPNLTIGPGLVKPVTKAVDDFCTRAKPQTKPLVDVHLMMLDPQNYLGAFVDAGADQIAVHAEACPHLHRVVQQTKALGAKAGVALNPHTPLSVLEYVLDELDLVLIMSVNPGFGGQSLIESTFCKIEALKEQITRRGLSTLIEVDGGVKPHNAHRFVSAGADALVAGSAVYGVEDRAAAIEALRASKPA